MRLVEPLLGCTYSTPGMHDLSMPKAACSVSLPASTETEAGTQAGNGMALTT